MLRRSLSIGAFVTVAAAMIAANQAEPKWWIVANLTGERVAIQPNTGETRPLPDPATRDIVSPDGTHIVRIATVSQSPRDFDLVVADVDPKNPDAKINARVVTTGPEHARPTNPMWTPSSRGLLFLAGAADNRQAWYVDVIEPKAAPVRLSDGEHPASNLCVSPGGSIAYFALIKTEGKQLFHNLIIIDRATRTIDFSGAKRTTLVTGEHLTSMAYDPEGRKLAYAGINTMHVHDFATQHTSEIHFDAVSPKLINHLAWQLAWRPDGKVIATMMSFAGGISYEAGNGPPRMFAEDKVFLIPANWSAPSPTYDPNAKFPSPTIDNPAEDQAFPMPADESKPGWIKGPRGRRVNQLEWIAAEQVPVGP